MLAAPAALALPEDGTRPIRVQADRATLDEQQNSARYEGNVVLTQGTLRIEADTLVIHADQQGIRRLEAVGKPAHYSQQIEPDAPLTHGYGLTIRYDLESERMVLEQQARLERAADSFAGARIEIDTRSNRVIADGGNEEGARVEMVIQPRNSAQ